MRRLIVLNVKGYRLLLVAVMIAAMVETVFGVVLVDYSADTLPPPPWEFISNGPPAETSQHRVFVQDSVLHMIDNALLPGNTLGFEQHVPFDPNQTIEVEFRARVLSGESFLSERAPFEVWLYNGTVRADLSVGPQSITAVGSQESRPLTPVIILNKPINGIEWHVYRYRLDPTGIEWWVDGISVGSATTAMLIPNVTEDDRRINMFITSATANVELDYLIVNQTSQLLRVSVGYLDTLHGDPPAANRPIFETGRGTTVIGDPDSHSLCDAFHPCDTGVIAVDFASSGNAQVTIESVTVVTDRECPLFAIWDSQLPVTLKFPSTNLLVLLQTVREGNFDTSACGLGLDPVVIVKIQNGPQLTCVDTGRVLLGREDAGAQGGNESSNFQQISCVESIGGPP